ncbi:hypothetical protein [Streptomyces sp. NPDC005283]
MGTAAVQDLISSCRGRELNSLRATRLTTQIAVLVRDAGASGDLED